MKLLKFISKTFAVLILFTFTLNVLPAKVMADGRFVTDSTVIYKVDNSGKTTVTNEITIENLDSAFYANSYSLFLENIGALNIKAVDDQNQAIPFDQTEENQKLKINLKFPNPSVGMGAKRHFFITYENSNFAVKTGEVWEISIPKLGDGNAFRNYMVELIVPDSLGQEAYISPLAVKSSNENGVKTYIFNKQQIEDSGVTAGFGQFQIFNFNLAYHLENPLKVNSQTEIALPPDTAFQKVYLTKIDPKPVNVQIDKDGNYLAIYKLSPRQRLDISVEGSVQIFAGYRTFPMESGQTILDNLKPTAFWQTNDPQIKKIAAELKTPQEIYNFVSKTLKYDFNRVQPNAQRMGASDALKNPNKAICMEFTDLFIALSRAAGIPAREINGYAYTENKELEPISFVADVLHSWPEYYDKNRGIWIPVDPTWGSTSGVDYFNKLDLRHFAFVIHGESDKEPYSPGSYKLGPNPQKDVYVSFGKLPQSKTSIAKLKVTTTRNIPFFDLLYTAQIYNPGPATLYSIYPSIYFDDKFHSKSMIAILPPYSYSDLPIKIPYNLLGNGVPNKLKVQVNESQIVFSTNKSQIVINSLVMIFATFILVIVLILFKLKRNIFTAIGANIEKIYAKTFGKFRKNKNS